jgi:hypothetical protein
MHQISSEQSKKVEITWQLEDTYVYALNRIQGGVYGELQLPRNFGTRF